MEKIFTVILGLTTLVVLSSCAHSHKVDGPQEKSEIPAGIRVGIGGKEVREGEKVAVLKTSCRQVSGGGDKGSPRSQCVDQKVGEAMVLKVLDHDSAIVQPEANLQMDSSMKVEKQQ
jgi:hypothetical protein